MGRYRGQDGPETKGHKFKWFGNNRVLCDVLEDMRRVVNANPKRFSVLKGLIEEAQVMGNRMEAALGDQKDLVELNQEFSKARKAYKKLQLEYAALEGKVAAKRSKDNKS